MFKKEYIYMPRLHLLHTLGDLIVKEGIKLKINKCPLELNGRKE